MLLAPAYVRRHDSERVDEVSQLVRARQIYIVPSLNPDGSEYDIASGSYQFWRKNRQPYQGIYGTDNNRNYSYNWGCCGGSSGDPNSEVSRPSASRRPRTSGSATSCSPTRT